MNVNHDNFVGLSDFLFISGTNESSGSSSLLRLSSIVDRITNGEKIALNEEVSEN